MRGRRGIAAASLRSPRPRSRLRAGRRAPGRCGGRRPAPGRTAVSAGFASASWRDERRSTSRGRARTPAPVHSVGGVVPGSERARCRAVGGFRVRRLLFGRCAAPPSIILRAYSSRSSAARWHDGVGRPRPRPTLGVKLRRRLGGGNSDGTAGVAGGSTTPGSGSPRLDHGRRPFVGTAIAGPDHPKPR